MNDSDRRSPKITWILSLVSLTAWGIGLVSAQGADPSPVAAEVAAPAEELPPPVEAIPLSEVTSEAERINAEVVDLRTLAAPADKVTAVRDELQGLEDDIARLEQEPVHTDPESVSWSELDSVGRQWKRLATKLELADGVVGERSRMLDGRATGIARAEQVWTRTREVLLEQESPGAVIERVGSVLRDLAEIQAALKQRQAELFTLQDRISSDQIRVAQATDQLSAVSGEVRRKILARTDPPLWEAIAADDDEQRTLREQWGASWERAKSDLAEFWQDHKNELILHALLTVVLMILLARLRRRARGWEGEEQAVRAAAAVLSRPMAAGYVVSATLTILLYPDAPAPVYRIAYLSATVPLLLLVRAVVPDDLRRPLYGPVGLFAMLHLGCLVPGLPLFQRLLYFTLTLAAVVGLAVMLRRFNAEGRMKAGPWWRATVITCRIAVVLLLVSLLANLFGLFELTLILTSGLFNSAFMALATVVSVLILDGAVGVAMETETARKLRMIRYHPQPIRRRVSRAIHVAGAVLWLWVTLRVFDLWDLIRAWFVGLLGRPWTVGTLQFSLGGAVAFVLTIWIAVLVSRFVRFVLDEDVYPRVRLARGLPGTISMLVRYGILAVGFLVAVAAAGIPLSNFAIIAGALSVGIGFGLQNVVNNFVSGLILAFERPIQIGDTVEVGQVLGEVRMIGIRASNVRTFDGAEIIVPNGDLISAQVTNWTLSDRRRRIRLNVGVAYGTDPQRVIDLLNEVASKHEDVWNDPQPAVLFNGFGDSSLDFEMRFWTRAHDRWQQIRSEVVVAVNTALNEAGIEIPFPQRDLHVRSVDADAARSLGETPFEESSAPDVEPPADEERD